MRFLFAIDQLLYEVLGESGSPRLLWFPNLNQPDFCGIKFLKHPVLFLQKNNATLKPLEIRGMET